MTNQEYLSTLSPEDFYTKLEWLLHDYGRNYIDTRIAIINWLKEEYKNPSKWNKCSYFGHCPNSTMPDKNCLLYCYLKKIIKENENDNK